MKKLKWLDEHFEEALLVVLLVLIACVELLQVVFRNLSFVSALTWPEEFCRYCWIWSVFISLPYTIRKGSMLRVSLLVDALPAKGQSILNIFVDIINAAVMLLLAINSISVVQKIAASGETSPAMLWPMWLVYAIMLPCFFLGVLRALQQAVRHSKEIKMGGAN